MTPAEQHAAMSIRIIDAALAELRQRAEADELASHVHRLCADASDARHIALWRRRLREQEWRP